MLEHTKDLNAILHDLDSLINDKNDIEYDYPKSIYISKYHDDKYFVGLDSNNRDFAPKRIDSTYYEKLEDFKARYNSKLSDTIKCEFWYEIDTFGIVNNIEIKY